MENVIIVHGLGLSSYSYCRLIQSLPIWVLEVPVIREIVLGFSFAYARMVNLCCSKRIDLSEAKAQRLLLKGKDGIRAVVAIGKNMNFSFDIAEWGGSDGLKHMPMQVLWSACWTKQWIEEGNWIAQAFPQAKFATHSGGR
ncbi:hypothetical protein L6164_020936 [Bauhinia variegata]|uniref:Uncharacterized protein n=1 Tax=Bauhinia variegata TaxID=167791 RepID=A0ACB9MWX0_BAUVA|nr:hypothetical protein L6164_020936 [Bauhinia variegata]